MTKRTHGRTSAPSARGAATDGERRTPAELSDEATESSTLAALWKEFKANADPSARERLILNYSPLVKYVAGRVSVGLPQNIEQADLVSYGIFGLIDWIPRSVRSKAREVERAIGKLENDLRRPPTDGELALELGVSIDDLQDMLNQINLVSVVALDELLSPGGEKGEKVSLVDTLEDTD